MDGVDVSWVLESIFINVAMRDDLDQLIEIIWLVGCCHGSKILIPFVIFYLCDKTSPSDRSCDWKNMCQGILICRDLSRHHFWWHDRSFGCYNSQVPNCSVADEERPQHMISRYGSLCISGMWGQDLLVRFFLRFFFSAFLISELQLDRNFNRFWVEVCCGLGILFAVLRWSSSSIVV